MDMRTLEGFLLHTAAQDWDRWYGETRLIFADFLDDSGQHVLALALRTMEVAIADEFRTKGRGIDQIAIMASDKAAEFYGLKVEGRSLDSQLWTTVREGRNTSGYHYSFTFNGDVLLFESIRLSISVETPIELVYRVVAEDGRWFGTLSLDRARLRCRRRVLEWFGQVPALHLILHLTPPDDSPRWMPNEPPRGIVGGLRMVGGDPTEPKPD